MEINKILSFLQGIATNNNREWYQEHKAEYEVARKSFMADIDKFIMAMSKIDPSIAHLTAKDTMYRFNRDTRFSPDKSPYKRHFGAYIASHGKKGLHGGYYIHVQPGMCFVSAGCYWLPTNILTSVRNEIMGNEQDWIKAVENGQFVKLFGYVGEGHMGEEEMDSKGFGLSMLKKGPKDFPTDYELIRYLKMKDYCTWRTVDASIFAYDSWIDQVVSMMKVAKPMVDFVNNVIDDYE